MFAGVRPSMSCASLPIASMLPRAEGVHDVVTGLQLQRVDDEIMLMLDEIHERFYDDDEVDP